MQNSQYVAHEVETNDFNEPDKLFGICQAAGEDLGINPFFLRIGLVGLLFFGPAPALGAYVGLGLLVGASRLLFPKPDDANASVDESTLQPVLFDRNEHEPQLIAA
jgi:hypothetical protein